MITTIKKSERGQVLILIVLAIVGLLGFTALAIDGGLIYSDRRIAQNAADAASLAGAGKVGEVIKSAGIFVDDWDCSGASILAAQAAGVIAAYDRAARNDFEDGVNGATVTVATSCENNSGEDGKYIDVKVEITAPSRPNFAHFVFQGPIANSVIAIARMAPPEPFAGGKGILSLTDSCTGKDRGIKIGGTITVSVDGGDIYSNSCLKLEGSDGSVEAEEIYYYSGDSYSNPAGKSVSPTPEGADKNQPEYAWPVCDKYAGQKPTKFNKKWTEIEPGYYDRIDAVTGDLTMKPGLYCIDGKVNFTGGTLIGENVTIVLLGNSGDSSFNTGGNSIVKLSAPPVNCIETMPEACPDAVGGLLLYLPKTNSDSVTVEGKASSYFIGTIYAPSSHIYAGGTADLSNPSADVNYTQIIGDSVKIAGTADVKIIYDDDLVVHLGGMLSLAK